MRFYKVSKFFPKIGKEVVEVEVERETEKSVWINGSRYLKTSSYDEFYKDREDAENAAALYFNKKIRQEINAQENAKCNIEKLKEMLKNVGGELNLEEPKTDYPF
jgi:vancomycin permeability regulator SanA